MNALPAVLLALAAVPAHAVELRFTAGGNAHLDAISGPVDLGVTTITKTGIAVTLGATLDLTVTSTGGTIHSADVGLGVTGGSDGGRLSPGEALALSFNRDVVVTGYSLERFDPGEDSTHATPAHGPVTETTATVAGLHLPLAPGQPLTISTLTGDGIRLATLDLIPDAAPAADDFYQVLRGSPACLLDVGANDLSPAPLSAVSDPPHGTAAIAGAAIAYTPDAGHAGPDSFTYTRADASTATVTVYSRTHPNFVFILADDQGWTSLDTPMDATRPAARSDYHLTPRISRLADEGMRFPRGYSPAPNCSPSRYALLTGKSCLRLGFTDIVGRNVNPQPDTARLLVSPGKKVDSIQAAETTIPELLKSIAGANYATAHFGKWHLAGGGPAAHGFDAGDGPTDNADGNQGPANTAVADPKQAYSLTSRATAWLAAEARAGHPVYLQVSHYAVHEEIQFSAAGYDAYQGIAPGTVHSGRPYAAMVNDLDTAVGRLLDALDSFGLRHSTYVVYQADNGCPLDLSTSPPLRGYKPEVWEGGVRVPTIVRGPGVAAASRCDQPVMGIDILPTLWHWAGQPAATLPANLDGASLAPAIGAITNGLPAPAIARPGELVVHTPHYVVTATKDQRPRTTIYDGPWKLVAQFELGTIELYNLDQRIEENADLAATEVGKRWQLWVRLRDYMKRAGALYALPDPDNFGPADGIDDGDADNDGLPDAWEMREMLSISFDGSADTDGDGATDAEEFANGTDPLMAGAVSIRSVTRHPDASLTLAWRHTPGLFRIETSPDLDRWLPLQTVTADTHTAAVTIPANPAADRAFYRVVPLP